MNVSARCAAEPALAGGRRAGYGWAMLSYQHIYHAGNLADVQKHMWLSHILSYLTEKDKPLSYIETHAGRGLYDLGSAEAEKTGEAAQGIAAVEKRIRPDHPYRQRLAETRARWGDAAYPGSPLIAALTLRDSDTLHLCELHPQEHHGLYLATADFTANLYQKDGFQQALSITPPMPRRGVLLCDPSYEIKEDYTTIPGHFAAIARKWNVGILMLWYPILTSGAHVPMLETMEQNHPEALRHEVRFPPVRDGHRMIGSGMFIINPPYGSDRAAAEISRLFRA